MSDDRVDIINPQGELVTVPQRQYDAALAQGFKPLDQAQKQEAARRDKYGSGVGTELRAGAEGAARGISFGLSDAALGALGADKEGLRERKERNPYSAGIGEAAGIGAGLLLPTGVVGAGVKGAAAAGELGARGAAALLGRAGVEGGTIASRALASGAKAATGSAIEGALYGAGQGVSEAALGDPADAAEKILAHATMGALLGGGLGGAAGALGGVGSKALARLAKPAAAVDAESSVAQQALNGAGATKPEGLISEWLNDLAGEQALRAAGLPKSAYKKLDRVVKGLPDADNAVAQDAAEEMTLHRVAADIMRKNRLARAGDTFEDVGNRVANHISDASARASKFIAETDAAAESPLFNIRAYADDMREFGKQFENRPEMAAHHKALLDRVEKYEALADQRAGAVRLTDSELAQRQNLLDRIEELSSVPDAKSSASVQKQITGLKSKLTEHEKDYAAAIEDVRTSPSRDLSASQEKLGTLRQKLEQKRQSIADKIEQIESAANGDSAAAQSKIASLKEKLNSLPEPQAGSGNGNITLAEAEAMKRDFNDVMEKAGSNVSTLIGKQSRGIFNRHIEEAAQQAASPEAFAGWKLAKREQEALLPVLKGNESKLQSLAANRSFSLTDNIGGAAAIAHFGVNPVGALSALGVAGANKVMREYGSAAISDFAARAAQGMGAQRGAQALQLLHIERTKNAMTQRLQDAAQGIASSLGQAPKAVTPLSVVGMDKLTMLPEQKADDSKAVTHDLHNRITELTNLAGNPQMLQQRLEEAMGDMPQFAPRVTAQMHLTAAEAVKYLADKVPKNPYPDAPLDIRQAWRPPQTQMVAFERTIRAIHDPVGTMEEFRDGHVTKEAADALRAVYPTMYAKLLEHVVPAVVHAPRVPLQRRLQLANMLGAELDVFTSAGFAATMQQVYAQSGHAAAAPARPAVSKNYRAQQSETPMQRALNGDT